MTDVEQQAKAIFLHALENYTPGEWRAYLDGVCQQDSALRARVEELLRAHADLGSYPSQDPDHQATVQYSEPGERPGSVIGHFKLLQKIGEGGFGVVYMAEQQEPVQRQVALKVIKPGMDTREVVARFEAERQALALMDHPNIARVLDAGATESERPYFVMELVRGVPITEYCDQNRLSTQERLTLFIDVCDAITHAHQKGVIHRDIKPSNVMVTLHDVRPVIKVIDFGIAKAINQKLTEKTLFTRYAQMIGTPVYMSPEQAEMSGLDVDTRTDIYSLGVLLYELLTGVTPFSRVRFRDAAYDEIRRIIREEDPPKPSSQVSTLDGDTATDICKRRRSDPKRLCAVIRGDLDWIAMKALEKDRSRRYDTAGNLAADIRHYLNDEPVIARPPSASYRVLKFARKYRAAVVTSALVLVVLILAAFVASWQAIRAQNALSAESLARRAAQNNLELAYHALDRIYLRVVEEELPRHPDRIGIFQQLLADALEFYRSFAEQLQDTASREKLAVAYARAGNIALVLGNNIEALQFFEAAIPVFEDTVREHPTHGIHLHQLSGAHHMVGQALSNLGRLTAAHAALEKAVTASLQLVEAEPSVEEYRIGAVIKLRSLATLHKNLGCYREAEQGLREALRLGQALPRTGDGARGRHVLAKTEVQLAMLLSEGGRYQEANQLYDQALDTLRWLNQRNPDSLAYVHSLCLCHLNRSSLLRVENRVTEAADSCRETLSLAKQLVEEHPLEAEYQSLLVDAYTNMFSVSGDFETARDEAMIQNALQVAAEFAERHPDVPEYQKQLVMSLNNVGATYEGAHRLTEAEAHYERAAAVADELIGRHAHVPDFLTLRVTVLKNLGDVRGKLGQNASAEEPLVLASQYGRELAEAYPENIKFQLEWLDAHRRYALLLRQLQRPEEAVEALQVLIKFIQQLQTSAQTSELTHQMALAQLSYGNLLFDLRRYPEGLAVFKECEQQVRAMVAGHLNVAKFHSLLAHCLMNQGDLLEATGEPAAAATAYREAWNVQRLMLERFPEAIHRAKLLQITEKLAALLFQAGRLHELGGELNTAIEVGEQLLEEYPDVAAFQNRLSSIYNLNAIRFAMAEQPSRALEQTEAAYLLIESLAERFPENTHYVAMRNGLLNNMAMFADQAGDYERMKKAVEDSYRLRPDDPSVLNEYAWFLSTVPIIEWRDPSRAVDLAERAVSPAGDNASYIGTLGTAYYRHQQWDAAIERLRQAISLTTSTVDDCYNHFYLAMALWQSGQQDAAREAHRRAVDLLEQLPAEQRPQHQKHLQALVAEWEALAGESAEHEAEAKGPPSGT